MHKPGATMEASQYDLIILGSGPAGEGAAMNAVKLGKKVAVVEQFMEVARACRQRKKAAGSDWRSSEDYEQRVQHAEDLARRNAALKLQRWCFSA